MKIRYAIEKEIEVSDNENDEMIQKIIENKCKEENGLDYLWIPEEDLKENDLNGLLENNLNSSFEFL